MFTEPTAQLVYDGQFRLPAECGEPREDQLQGTRLEQLCELSGRECYDSLGRGRDSKDYHTHILQVGHLSVYEHANLTVELRLPTPLSLLPALINRPGVWVSQSSANTLRVTLNLRTAVEWDNWSGSLPGAQGVDDFLYSAVVGFAAEHAPQIVRNYKPRGSYVIEDAHASVVEPETDDEKWISMRLTGSRGLTHEQVRHGDFTAISQRSTRYVDEAESSWVAHPLIKQFIKERTPFQGRIDHVQAQSQKAYAMWVGILEPWLTERGVDKVTARKQARGAARGFLGNALESSMIFSASVSQWRRMMFMRASAAADAEIRVLYNALLRELRLSAHSDRFADLTNVPSPDGIGEVVECQSQT